jgi:hypothetical protein
VSVLRISDVVISKADLEVALQTKLDRFEPARSGSLQYAQLDVPMENGWRTVVDWIETIGPRISALRQEGLVGPASVDLAIAFGPGKISLSIEVPSYAAEVIGRHGIEIEFSVYLTSDE